MNAPEASRWLIEQQSQVDGLLSARKQDKLGFLILALVGPALSPAWVDQQVSRTWFYGSNPKSSTRYVNIHVAGKRARQGRITFPSTNCKKEERSRLPSLAAADCENQMDQQDQESANPLIYIKPNLWTSRIEMLHACLLYDGVACLRHIVISARRGLLFFNAHRRSDRDLTKTFDSFGRSLRVHRNSAALPGRLAARCKCYFGG